ncbi:hypothetical protein [Cognatishimia activa]|uniref:hypothetical protein n=1 Tax=Cognatishimia activa TaxID=1715691 RepID=UPI0006F05177|nr:hypothetical protein [Cognatishimia activa]CUJ30053.1 hypothetical protein TA5113_02944 [Cognatishimia activa]
MAPKAIRREVRLEGYEGYRRDEIRDAAKKPEPQRSQSLRKIRDEVRRSLKFNISRYREVARELHAYRKRYEGEPIPNVSASVHTSMGLKFSHIYNDFGHLELLDSLPHQVDLFDLL